MSEVPRPVLRWHGGKWRQAKKIIRIFPPHRRYVEPYGGAFSVGLRKPRSYAEVWNDLDGELVNLFRVLRCPTRAGRLVQQLELTPFARQEFEAAYLPTRSAVERARRLIVRSFMGHGGDGASGVYRTGFRANSSRSGSIPATDWSNLPASIVIAIERLQGVIIESRPALQVMAAHDGPDTLHFVDPPYLIGTRARANRRTDNGGVYRHEMTDDDHRELLTFVKGLRGCVVLCGYPSALYDDALTGWTVMDHAAHADGAQPRLERLWINPACSAAMPAPGLFEMGA